MLAFIVVVWSIFSAHRASAKLKEATEAQSVITVATIKPQPLSDLTDLILPGNLQANYEAPIYARTSGYLKRWLVDIGTPVKAGQLLGEIEAPEVDSQLNQAQADLVTAEANQKIASVTAERWRLSLEAQLANGAKLPAVQADNEGYTPPLATFQHGWWVTAAISFAGIIPALALLRHPLLPAARA